MSRRSRKLPGNHVLASIESLSHEGRGIARVDGKTVFIDNALPGEQVMFRYTGRRSAYDEGYAIEIIEASAKRVEPGCPHFEICGGCSLQHMPAAEQIALKEKVLQEQFRHIGGVVPQAFLAPLTGPEWGYRRKARLGVRYVVKKGRLIIGFREKQGKFLADLQTCKVLHPQVGNRLTELQVLLGSLDRYDHIPQVEVAVGTLQAALVIRHMQPLTEADMQRLQDFQQDTGLAIYLQSGGPATIIPLNTATNQSLAYTLEQYGIEIRFQPTDFTQVNHAINEAMVASVIGMLKPDRTDAVLDLFCGLGNFSLPLAKYAARVTGVEGSSDLVARAKQNADVNDITNAQFHAYDLMQEDLSANFLNTTFDKILLDPPRSGAKEIITLLDMKSVQRIVYVSCNPATLARDAGILVQKKGFKLTRAGVMDMFPHTAHIESIACFER
jgi:23S rRNA (uracil1939-C5)-methyltransferase